MLTVGWLSIRTEVSRGMDSAWYLLRTKAGEERRACDHLARIASDTLLPRLKVRVRRWGRAVESVAPLFPCYLFAKLDLECELARVRYTRGVRDLIRFGAEPAIVPDWVMADLKRRCADGPVALPVKTLSAGERVRIIDGPLRDFEGIFERYLSGPERVGILLSAMGAGARAVMPAGMVVAAG